MANPSKEIPSFNEVMGNDKHGIPSFDEVMGDPAKKKVSSIDYTNLDAGGGKNSAPIQSSSIAQSPSEEETPIELAKKAEELSRKTTPVYNENTGITNKDGEKSISYYKPDETAMAESSKINEAIKAQGYNPKKLTQDFDGIPDDVFTLPEFNKGTLLNDYKENPPLYERKIATAKAQTALHSAIQEDPDAESLWHEVKSSYNNSNVGDLSFRRENLKRLVNIANQYGGEKKDEIIKNIATDFSNMYAEAAADPAQLVSDPNFSKLNSNQLAAYNWLQDTSPKDARKYQSALLSDADIKDNYDAQLQKQEAGKRLDEMGISLQQNYANEKRTPLIKEYQALYDKSQPGTLTDEESQRMGELAQQGERYTKILYNTDKDLQDISGKYPKAALLDADNYAQELIGQKHTGLDWLAVEMGKATGNTVSGVYNFAKRPFTSDNNNQIDQAELLGGNALSENAAYLKQGNQTTQTFKPTLSKELQADIDIIKNDPDLTSSEKRSQVSDLLIHRPGEWQRTPIEGGKTNVSLSSMMYGVGGLAANLAPFMAAELVTGGGATAGTLRKLTSAFSSAAATGFHDSYVAALEKGSENPYAEAMRVTAINSAAMAGASTPEAIKKMLGAEGGAISKMITGMTDDEIKLALKSEPKALSAFRKSLNAVKQAGSNIASSAAEGFKGGAKITAFTTAGQIANDAISGEVKPMQDYGKQALIETLKFGIFGTALGTLGKGVKKPTDISMAALSEFGKDPESGFRSLDAMQKDGSISPTDAAQIKTNIEKASKIFKSSPILNNSDLSPNAKREYLYNKMVEVNAKESAAALPPKQALEAEQTAAVAVHKNQILLDQPTEKQLEKRKAEVEKTLEPEVDADGKKKEINEKVKRDATAELQAIKEIQDDHAAKVADAAAKRLSKKEEDTKPSIPIEGTSEQGIPVGENVPPATETKTTDSLQKEEDVTQNADAALAKEIKDKNVEGIGAFKGDFADKDVIDYALDKASEDPTKFQKDNPELFDKIKDRIPTKKLQENLDFWMDRNSDSPNVKVLDDLITERENKSNESKGENIITEKKASPTAVESTENIQSPKEEQGEQPKGTEDIKDEDGVILSHKGLQEVATEFGLADVTPREKITDAKEFEDAGKTIDKWVEEKNYSKNIEGLTKKAEDGEALNFQERVILQQHLANERARVSSIREEKGINSPEYDNALRELNRLKEAGQTARSTAGAALRVGETRSFAKPTVEDWMTERMESAGTENLTEKQKEETQKQFDEYEAASKMADAKMEEMQNEISKLKAEIEIAKNKKGVIRKKNQEYLKKERQDIIAEMKEKLANINKGDNTLSSDIPYRKQLVVIVPSVLKLTRNLVETGVSKLGDIVDNIHEQIKDLVPGIQKKDVRDIIAGEYTEQKETKSSLQRQLEDVRDEAKLIKRLEDLKNNEPTTERAKRSRNTEITKLQEQIKDFKKEKADAEAAQKRVVELEAELDRIKNRQEKDAKSESSSGREKTQEEKDLESQIVDEKAKWKDELKTSPEDAAIKSAKNRNESITKKIEDKIANGDFTTEKKVPFDENKALQKANPKLYKDAYDAIVKKNEAKEKFDIAKQKDELSKTNWNAVADSFSNKEYLKGAKLAVENTFKSGGKLLSTAKAIKAGIDDSVTFVQLGMAVLANPHSGLKAKIEAFKDASNNQRFKRQLAVLHDSPFWNTIKESGLDITEPKSLDKEKVEELFRDNLLDTKIGGKVNLWTYTGGIFERLFTSMGNNMRLNMFTKRVEFLQNKGMTLESHPQEYKDAARIINELTGRGKVNENLQKAMPVISPIVWAPKMLSSTMNLLGISDAFALASGDKLGSKGLYKNLTKTQLKYAGIQMGKGIGMGVTVMSALAVAGWSVDLNPYSTTFGSVKHGTKTYNVFGRYASFARLAVQLITGKKDTKKGTVDLDAKGGRGHALLSFMRGKMTPVAGEASDYWLNSKKNFYTKEPIKLKGLPNDLLTPISFGDLQKGFEQDGSSSLLTRFLPAFEGLNVTDERDFEKKIDNNLDDLLERNKTSDAQDTNEFINYKDGRRKITEDESKSYKKLRDEKVDKSIRQLWDKGTVVADTKGSPILKPYKSLTPDEVAKATTQIKRDATDDAKKELFGFKSKREEALDRIKQRKIKNLSIKLGLREK